ncbi:Cell division protein ftsj [Nesidiocoris tenuis]|uniref:rRNA methyltransferase 2, mitochondrial n=1 Tax=Nesidiocoris tenuis TaxID=355587 RepID=A0ABN7B1X3_9HEMI|nr:Cell division protein ftsj [Nesidiocoris tenuis]
MKLLRCRRSFSTSASLGKEIAKNLKGKSTSSQGWIQRQLRDPYVEKARQENYRCRSAYKLLEIDEKFKILKPGQCVVDIGAAPGSWTQVAVKRTNADEKIPGKPRGFVVALDRLNIFPIDGAALVTCDFTRPDAEKRLVDLLNGRPVDVVLSDMAPNATGVKSMDHDRIVALALKAFKFGLQISAEGATVLMKLWEGRSCKAVETELSKFYDVVRWIKPKSSRSDSTETFILGRGFKKSNVV